MTRDVRQLALAYLAAHQVVTLATNGPAGLWAAAVFYASVDVDLIFLSAGHTRHARNIAASGAVAATIQEDYRDWPAIQGIQLAGTVTELHGSERDAARAIYQDKFPFIAAADEKLRPALARVNWYRLAPAEFFFIDNTLGLGHRDLVPLA